MMVEEIKAAAFKAEIEKAQQKMHGYKKEIEKFASMPLTETQSQRVARSNAALLARGGRRIPGGYLQPDAAQALEALVASGYARSLVAAISTALLDAQRKIGRNKS